MHEHWNNGNTKQYSRDLGLKNGIELVGVPSSLVVQIPASVANNTIEKTNVLNIFPNPVKDIATLNYTLTASASVHVELLTVDGKLVVKLKNIQQSAGLNTYLLNTANYKLTDGAYICKVIANDNNSNVFTSKMIIKK